MKILPTKPNNIFLLTNVLLKYVVTKIIKTIRNNERLAPLDPRRNMVESTITRTKILTKIFSLIRFLRDRIKKGNFNTIVNAVILIFPVNALNSTVLAIELVTLIY